MKRVIYLMLSIFISYPALAAEMTNLPNCVLYSNSFDSWNQEIIHSMIYTPDNGQIFVGQTNRKGSGGMDAWIFKTNAQGQIIWDKTIGGTQNDVLVDIVSTGDGGYMMIGTTWSKGNGQNDLWIVKVDPNGQLLWNKTYGTGAMETGNAITKNANDEFVIAGTKHVASFDNRAGQPQLQEDHFIWMLKVDYNGAEIWDERYHLEQMINITDLHQTVDQGYIVSAITATSNEDALVIKFDPSGLITWTSLLGGNTTKDMIHAIHPLNDGTFQLVGTIQQNENDGDGWLLKVSPQGNIMWEKVMGSYGSDAFHDITQSEDGAMVVAGTYGSDQRQDGNMWLVKIQQNGELLYDETFQQQVPGQAPVMFANTTQSVYAQNVNNQMIRTTDQGQVQIMRGDQKHKFRSNPYTIQPLPFSPATNDDKIVRGWKPNPKP